MHKRHGAPPRRKSIRHGLSNLPPPYFFPPLPHFLSPCVRLSVRLLFPVLSPLHLHTPADSQSESLLKTAANPPLSPRHLNCDESASRDATWKVETLLPYHASWGAASILPAGGQRRSHQAYDKALRRCWVRPRYMYAESRTLVCLEQELQGVDRLLQPWRGRNAAAARQGRNGCLSGTTDLSVVCEARDRAFKPHLQKFSAAPIREDLSGKWGGSTSGGASP